jgi:two-component system C4-dicarboxylate transport response regulator DctD
VPSWTSRGTIVVADDSEEMRDLLRTWLGRRLRDTTVVAAKNGLEVLAMMETLFAGGPEDAGPVVVITDYRMPGLDGMALLDRLQRSPYVVPCIVMTGFGDEITHERFAEHGALACFDKPVDLDRVARLAELVLSAATPRPSSF